MKPSMPSSPQSQYCLPFIGMTSRTSKILSSSIGAKYSEHLAQSSTSK